MDEEPAKKERSVFDMLDEVLPEKALRPKNFDNARELFDAIVKEDFGSCSSLGKLNKTVVWLGAFSGYITKVLDGTTPKENMLALFGIRDDDPEWSTILITKFLAAGNTKSKITDIYEKLASEPDMQSKEISIVTGPTEVLYDFIERGKKMLRDAEVVNFCNEVIRSVTQYFISDDGSYCPSGVFGTYLTENTILPFWLVCSSSGTGKSQFAYTLPMPAMYFIMASGTASAEQRLYGPFLEISTIFRYIYRSECDGYLKTFKENADLRISSLIETQLNNRPFSYRFQTVGFVVALWREMVKLKQKYPEKHWLECQCSITSVEYKPLTVLEGVKQLQEIHEQFPSADAKLPFCFFFDECHLQPNGSNEQFRFVRNLMRGLNVCFFGMGTNAGACNFADPISSNISRETPGVWCHLIFKLPKTAVTVLETMKEEIKVCLLEAHNQSRHTEITAEFVDSLFEFLANDRPLFSQYAFDAIKSHLRGNLAMECRVVPSCADVFWKIMNTICQKFVEAKRCGTPYNIGQFTYFTLKYWRTINQLILKEQFAFVSQPDERKHQKDLRKIFCGPRFVNQHLAMVGLPFDAIGRNLQMLIIYARGSDETVRQAQLSNTKNLGLGYKIAPGNNINDFYHYSWFPSFDEEPITGLAFSLYRWSFLSNGTTLNAFSQILTDGDVRAFWDQNTKFNGYLLELATTTACVVSSHANGFRGMPISEWLPRLFNELNFFNHPASIDERSELVNSEEFISNLKDIKIPFCCPQVSTEFSPEVIQKIKQIDPECYLGTVYNNIERVNGPRDFYITCNGKTIVNGECKLREHNLNFTELSSIISGFNDLSAADFYIVVARSVAEFKLDGVDEKYVVYQAESSYIDVAEGTFLYSIRRIMPDPENDLEPPQKAVPGLPRNFNPATNFAGRKIILLVGLREIIYDTALFQSRTECFKC